MPNQTNIRLGHHNGVAYLGDWYPTVQVFDQEKGDWPRYPYVETGDAFYSEAADYTITLDFQNAPDNLRSRTAASSSPTRRPLRDLGRTLREFAITFSNLYLTSTRWSAAHDGPRLLPPERARSARDTCWRPRSKALEWGNEHLGTYPYPTLTSPRGSTPTGGGQEYARWCIFASGDYNGYKGSTSTTSSPTRSSTSGSTARWERPGEDGWLDEEFGSLSRLPVRQGRHGPLRSTSPRSGRRTSSTTTSRASRGGASSRSTPSSTTTRTMSTSSGSSTDRERSSRRRPVRLGDDAYYRMLREYIAANRWGIASSTDLLERVLDKLPVDGPGLIRDHFSPETVAALGL